MSAYRIDVPPDGPPPPDGGDDRVLLAMNIVIALVRLVPAVVHHERWGPEPTVALLIALVCSSLLFRTLVHHRKDNSRHGDR